MIRVILDHEWPFLYQGRTIRQDGKKKALYLSVNVFSTKALVGDTIFYVSYRWRDRHFTWSTEPREGPAVKAVPSILGYF